MGIRDKIISGGNGINFTKETDSSADWPSIANSTYFRDVADGLIHYIAVQAFQTTLSRQV